MYRYHFSRIFINKLKDQNHLFLFMIKQWSFFFYLNSLYTFDMRKLSAPIMMHMDHVAAGECKSSQQIKLV